MAMLVVIQLATLTAWDFAPIQVAPAHVIASSNTFLILLLLGYSINGGTSCRDFSQAMFNLLRRNFHGSKFPMWTKPQ